MVGRKHSSTYTQEVVVATMSNQANTELFEKVAELMEYWTGTMHERILQRDLDADDLEALQYHANQAWSEMVLQEDEHGVYDEVK